MTSSPAPRPVFDRYALPLPRRREGPAAALSFLVHITIAILVLWRGAALFENGGGGGGAGPRGGGGGGGRPATSWVALPTPAYEQRETARLTAPPPAVTVPTVAAPIAEPVKLDVPPLAITMAPPAAIGTGEGTTGGPGEALGTGGGKGTGTGPGVGADSGSGSGGSASDIFGPTPLFLLNVPPGAPAADKIKHEVRFWIRWDGRVTRIEVSPPIKDSGYRRAFMEAMRGYVFGPAKTRDGRPIDYVYTIVVKP